MLLGGLLEVFSFGNWMVPLAVWLAPVVLLHFARSTTPVLGALGIWGISFLVFWFAAVVNWAWDRQFDWAAVQGGSLYAGIWCSVMFAGGARLALAPDATTIRIAGIGWALLRP